MPAVPAASMAVRVGGVVALVLGLIIWAAPGVAAGVQPIHMLAGVDTSVGLAVLALFAFRGGSPLFPLLAIAWAILMPVFGMAQATLLPDLRILVQVAHLAVGIIAIGMGEALALRIIRTERRLRNTR